MSPNPSSPDINTIIAQQAGKAQLESAVSVGAFLASLVTAGACFVLGLLVFVLLKDRFYEIWYVLLIPLP